VFVLERPVEVALVRDAVEIAAENQPPLHVAARQVQRGRRFARAVLARFVAERDDRLVREAVRNELQRRNQVRVAGCQDCNVEAIVKRAAHDVDCQLNVHALLLCSSTRVAKRARKDLHDRGILGDPSRHPALHCRVLRGVALWRMNARVDADFGQSAAGIADSLPAESVWTKVAEVATLRRPTEGITALRYMFW
jgi:hypothetical protein